MEINKVLQDLSKYGISSFSTVTKPILDVSYLIDAKKLLSGKEEFGIVSKLIDITIKEVVTNVVSDIVSIILKDLTNLNTLSETIASIIREKSCLTDETYFYKFRINPNKVTITRRKLQTITTYGWGYYDIEYFGDELLDISVSGTTGLLLPPYPLPSLGITDVRLTPAYIKLVHLEKFYKKSSQSLFFTIAGRLYHGFLVDLSYSLDANNPRKIDYTFKFTAHPKFVFDLFSNDFEGFDLAQDTNWNNMVTPSVLQEGIEYQPENVFEYSSSFIGV
jgi:hypothetical protein